MNAVQSVFAPLPLLMDLRRQPPRRREWIFEVRPTLAATDARYF